MVLTQASGISKSLKYTSSPFSSATGQSKTFTVQNDPRAAWNFVFDSPSTGYTGAQDKKGFIITGQES